MQEKPLLTKTATVSRTKSALLVAFAVISVGGIALAGFFGFMSKSGYTFTCKNNGNANFCSFQKSTVKKDNSKQMQPASSGMGTAQQVSERGGECAKLTCQYPSLTKVAYDNNSGKYTPMCGCAATADAVCSVPSCPGGHYKFINNLKGCAKYECVTDAQYKAESCANADSMSCPSGTIKVAYGTEYGSNCPHYECSPVMSDGSHEGPYVVTGPDKQPKGSYVICANWGPNGKNRSDYCEKSDTCPPVPSSCPSGSSLEWTDTHQVSAGKYCATYTCSGTTAPSTAGNSISGSGGATPCPTTSAYYQDENGNLVLYTQCDSQGGWIK